MHSKSLASIVFLLICFAIPHTVIAQDGVKVDSMTALAKSLYDNEKWNELIESGENYLKTGNDFYTLRNYIGIAYYMKKNFFKAIDNFERALELGFPVAKSTQLLYKAYELTGRTADMHYTYFLLPENLKRKIKPLENSLVDNLIVESAIGISDDYNKNENSFPVQSSWLANKNLAGDEFLFTAAINQLPLRLMNVTYAYTFKSFERKNIYQYGGSKIENEYKRTQNEFYNRFDFPTGFGTSISAAVHFTGYEENLLQTDPAKVFADDTLSESQLIRSDFSDENFVLHASVKKYFSRYELMLGGSFSYLNNKHQSQYGLTFAFFPVSNAAYHSSTSLVIHDQESISNLIVTQNFGFNFSEKFSGNMFVAGGKIRNYNTQYAAVLYDNPDLTNYLFGIDAEYLLAKNFTARFRYEYQSRERNSKVTQSSGVSSDPSFKYSLNRFQLNLGYSF